MKKIVLTGGGTAGHVTPNLALLPYLREAGYEITYIGSYNGIEKSLMEEAGVEYIGISSGKLRRYLSLKNLADPFRVNKGCGQAKRHLKRIAPDVIFSKGGFVSVPVVIAASRLKIPVIVHESDLSIGLANKISIRHAYKVCCNFPETMKEIPEGRSVLTGSPIREELKNGDREKAIELCGFDPKDTRKTILVMCGSLGSVVINQNIKESLPKLSDSYRIIHVVGKGNLDESFPDTTSYKQFEYAGSELADIMALSDMVVSRAGANSISEFLMLTKPNLLIPLSKAASRGDQILNAQSFKKQGYSAVLPEEEMNPDSLVEAIKQLDRESPKYVYAMQKCRQKDSVGIIMDLINEASNSGKKKKKK